MPSKCACGENFIKVSLVMHCARGRFAHIRNMEIRDTFTKLLDDVCFDEIEPILQSLQPESLPCKTTSTEDEATLDFNKL